jgi:hypothetical protein
LFDFSDGASMPSLTSHWTVKEAVSALRRLTVCHDPTRLDVADDRVVRMLDNVSALALRLPIPRILCDPPGV